MKATPYFNFLLAAVVSGSMLWPVHACADAIAAQAFGGRAIGSEALAKQRGGTEAQVRNEAWIEGTVRDNRAVNVQTGSNLIGGASFAGAAGLITALQNSGNNVLFQNSTIVNVQVR